MVGETKESQVRQAKNTKAEYHFSPRTPTSKPKTMFSWDVKFLNLKKMVQNFRALPSTSWWLNVKMDQNLPQKIGSCKIPPPK